jgi:hypothetical protein
MFRREAANSIGGGRAARLEAALENYAKSSAPAANACHTPMLPAHFGATVGRMTASGGAMAVSHEVGFPAGRVSGGAYPCSGLSV